MFRTKPVPPPPQASAERAFLAELTDECDAERIRQIVGERSRLDGFGQRFSPVLSRIAAHPNTPPEVLASLLADYSAEFCQNPVAPLLTLDPQVFLAAAYPAGLLALLRNENATPALVHLLATGAFRDDDVVESARLHISVAGELPSATWAQKIRTYWRELLAQETISAQREVAELVDLGLAPASLFGATSLLNDDAVVLETHLPFLLLYEHSGYLAAKADYHRLSPGDFPFYWLFLQRVYGLLWLWSRFCRSRSVLLRRVSSSRGMVRLALECLLRPGHAHTDVVTRRFLLRHPAVTPRFRNTQQRRVLGEATRWHDTVASCIAYLSPLAPPSLKSNLYWLSGAFLWQSRLIAALALPYSQARLFRYNRATGIGILRCLAQDGNRFVRAAAQARLRGEEFTWEEVG